MEIRHIAGKDNLIADALSRAPDLLKHPCFNFKDGYVTGNYLIVNILFSMGRRSVKSNYVMTVVYEGTAVGELVWCV